ncbi:MAG: type VI secretion system Vgr family protein, partial [Pseudomonas sp.]
THAVQGRHEVEAGERMVRRTQVYKLDTSQRTIIRGPGGTLTIDAGGIQMEAVAIKLKGPVQISRSGARNEIAVESLPMTGKPLERLCALQSDGTCPLVDCPCGKNRA